MSESKISSADNKQDEPVKAKPLGRAMPVTPEFEKLISDYSRALAAQEPIGGPFIHVDNIASRIAVLYERFRQVIDWKEEHLLRRAAISRILKRKLISELPGFNLAANLHFDKIARTLVIEVIRGGHFPNDRVPKANILKVRQALEKYVYILTNAPVNQKKNGSIKTKFNFFNWIIEILACEIEEILGQSIRENALMDFMINRMQERIQVQPPGALNEFDTTIQINVAVFRTLFNLDSPIISYRILKLRYPQWLNPTPAQLQEITQGILDIKRLVDHDLDNHTSGNFHKICDRFDTVYLILGDIIISLLHESGDEKNKISEIIASPDLLEKEIKKAYNKRLSTQKYRLFRMAIFSTLSIFVSSSVSLFIIEVPLAKLFYGRFIPSAIFVDLMFPTGLMFFLVALVRLPKESNFKTLVKEIKKITYQTQGKDVYEVRVGRERNKFMSFVIGLLYILGSLLSMSFVFYIFKVAKIPPTSIYIDTLNIAVIIFAALVIRKRAKELVVEEKTSLLEFALDTLSVPIAKIGQWLANKWKEYNIVSVFFTALIDMPFSLIIELVENWSSFIKEKKSGLH